MTKATNAANYLFWLEQLQPTIRETEQNSDISPTGFNSIDMDHVQFSYPMRPRTRILRGIDLKVSIEFQACNFPI
jgi:ATP-binding cassette subfamily B (MDR/TAP) protein 1